MNGLLDGLKALGPGRLVAMAAVAAAMLGLLTLLMLRAPTERMALLYADLDPREAGQVVEVLERQHVPHQLAGAGGQITPAPVAGQGRPADRRVHRLRNLRSRRWSHCQPVPT